MVCVQDWLGSQLDCGSDLLQIVVSTRCVQARGSWCSERAKAVRQLNHGAMSAAGFLELTEACVGESDEGT